jgi:hypothetical protein
MKFQVGISDTYSSSELQNTSCAENRYLSSPIFKIKRKKQGDFSTADGSTVCFSFLRLDIWGLPFWASYMDRMFHSLHSTHLSLALLSCLCLKITFSGRLVLIPCLRWVASVICFFWILITCSVSVFPPGRMLMEMGPIHLISYYIAVPSSFQAYSMHQAFVKWRNHDRKGEGEKNNYCFSEVSMNQTTSLCF